LISRDQPQPVWTGAVASFANLDALALGFNQVAATLPLFDEAEHHQWYGANSQPQSVLNLALHIFNTANDMSDAERADLPNGAFTACPLCSAATDIISGTTLSVKRTRFGEKSKRFATL
jgi:hypothetical protein